MSEVSGRSREDPMPKGLRPRRVTPRPWSGAAAEHAGCNGTGMAEKSYPSLKSGVASGRSNPTPKARGSNQEDQPHVQGTVAALAQAGLEELSHVEGQEGWR